MVVVQVRDVNLRMVYDSRQHHVLGMMLIRRKVIDDPITVIILNVISSSSMSVTLHTTHGELKVSHVMILCCPFLIVFPRSKYSVKQCPKLPRYAILTVA